MSIGRFHSRMSAGERFNSVSSADTCAKSAAGMDSGTSGRALRYRPEAFSALRIGHQKQSGFVDVGKNCQRFWGSGSRIAVPAITPQKSGNQKDRHTTLILIFLPLARFV